MVLLVRHAEVHNPGDILYGRLPRFRLSEKGREQAAALGQSLARFRLEAVYTSPLLRARQTADLIARFQGDVRLRRDRALLEVRTSYQGSPNSILKPGFSFYDPQPGPEDESMQDIWQRMSTFMLQAARRHPGGVVAGISHGDPITIVHVGLRGLDMTTKNLHSVVYAARASVTQVVLTPDRPPTVGYFNIAEMEERRL